MRLGVIGGTGLVRIENLDFLSSLGFEVISDDLIRADTEFGYVPLRCISFSKNSKSHELIFLQRHHGETETSTPPHNINHKANIASLKGCNVEAIVGICSVGSLSEIFPPGMIGYASQYIDFTGVATTFFDKSAQFTSVTNPFDLELNSKIDQALRSSQQISSSSKIDFCYYLAQGPQFETSAEIRAISMLGGEVVGMTMPREAKLSRELDIPYSAILISSNWAAGKEPGDPNADLSHDSVSSQANQKLAPVLDCLASLI